MVVIKEFEKLFHFFLLIFDFLKQQPPPQDNQIKVKFHSKNIYLSSKLFTSLIINRNDPLVQNCPNCLLQL